MWCRLVDLGKGIAVMPTTKSHQPSITSSNPPNGPIRCRTRCQERRRPTTHAGQQPGVAQHNVSAITRVLALTDHSGTAQLRCHVIPSPARRLGAQAKTRRSCIANLNGAPPGSRDQRVRRRSYSRRMKSGAWGASIFWRSGSMAKKLPTTVPVHADAPHSHGHESPSKAFSR